MLLGARQFFGKKKLPYDAEVEYLESTGTQWIDTGKPIPADFWFDATFDVTDTNSEYKTILGCRIGSGNNDYQFSFQGASNFFLARYGTNSNQYFAALPTGATHIRVASGGTLYIDGVYKRQLGVGSPSSLNMFVFALNNNGAVSQQASFIRLRSLKYGGANEEHDFIPVRVGGVGYMYDRVSKQLFGNQGTGNFIVGPDVVEVEYLESTGTQWIDTGVDATSVYGLQFDFQSQTNASDPNSWSSLLAGRLDNFTLGFDLKARNSLYLRYRGIEITKPRPTIPQNQWVSLSLKNNILTLAGNTYQVSTPIATLSDNIVIANNAAYSRPTSIIIGGLSLWGIDETVLCDLVPVRVGMEGAMMDRLTRKIYRNAGTGAFKIGADKKKTSLMCNSYVKDGLMAMWDGIENAGWGTHDASATTWKDLVGNLDIIVPSSDSFASDHLVHVSGTPQSESDTRICEGTNLTVESVFEASSDSTIYTCNTQAGSGTTSNASGFGQYSLRYQAAGNPSYARFSRGNGTSWGYSTYSSIPTPIGEICSLVDVMDFDVANNKYCYKYVNGQLVNTYPFRDGPVGYTVTGKMRVFMSQPCHGHCLRIYNRALTAEEIAQNYEIDKRRFNLP